ncbi:hypothetical protein QYE76_019328 [Lolium multiflorum]|uniref:Wall-associated receptor kinase galacturonan-binding domain-containing protein n=1 Tax=Lolium multiflorum TaxID=4521 RepID=A0AAD8R4A8_LOLMU|nr:hypothetical protein QYE76_019328 [Lolium multiflorum]
MLFILLLAAAAGSDFILSQAAAAEIALPGCPDKCGDVSIPYPFGMGKAGCFLPGFEVTCNTTVQPARAFLANTPGDENATHQEKKIMGMAGATPVASDNITVELLPVELMDYATNGPCGGRGCCEAVMPPDTVPQTRFGPLVNPQVDPDYRKEINPCSYGMLVEKSWYNFSTTDMSSYEVMSNKYSRGVPLVIEFAIRNGTCPAAGQQPPKDYACLSSSSYCANATSGEGYICKCAEHYDGNPYVPNGCQGKGHICCSIGS